MVSFTSLSWPIATSTCVESWRSPEAAIAHGKPSPSAGRKPPENADRRRRLKFAKIVRSAGALEPSEKLL